MSVQHIHTVPEEEQKRAWDPLELEYRRVSLHRNAGNQTPVLWKSNQLLTSEPFLHPNIYFLHKRVLFCFVVIFCETRTKQINNNKKPITTVAKTSLWSFEEINRLSWDTEKNKAIQLLTYDL